MSKDTAGAGMNPLHSRASVEWGTPDWLWDLSAKVLGGVDFDPCRAAHFARPGVPGIAERGDQTLWPAGARIVLNPPGGLTREFWRRALTHRGPIAWIGFSVEQLATLQNREGGGGPLAFPTCVLRHRVDFITPAGTPGGRPSHANYVTLLHAEDNVVYEFIQTFSKAGSVTIPCYPGPRFTSC